MRAGGHPFWGWRESRQGGGVTLTDWTSVYQSICTVCEVRNGSGHCPAHEDGHASLIVTFDGDTILVHCHAGCAQDDVIVALRAKGAWPEHGSTSAARSTTSRAASRDDATYLLRDLGGRVVAVQKRYRKKDGSKATPWFRLPANVDPLSDSPPIDHLEKGLGGRKTPSLPLYLTEKIPTYDPRRAIFICEGAKDALGALEHGLQPLATMTGSGQTPRPEAFAMLAHADHVIFWPDRDDVGRKHAERCLARCPPGPKLAMLDPEKLEGLPLEKGSGASDWRPPSDPAAALTAATVPWKGASTEHTGLAVECLADVPMQHIEWWLHGLIPKKYLTLIAGRPKAGKSLLIAYWLAEATKRGERVLYLALEDGHGDVVRPRIQVVGGDPAAVDVNAQMMGWTADPDGWQQLGEVAIAGQYSAVVIDTITSALPATVQNADERDAGFNLNNNAHVAALLGPGVALAREIEIPIIVGCHSPKARLDSPEKGPLGATAFSATARSIILVGKTKGGQRWYTTSGNLAPEQARHFSIEVSKPTNGTRGQSGAGVPYVVPGDMATVEETFDHAQAIDDAQNDAERQEISRQQQKARELVDDIADRIRTGVVDPQWVRDPWIALAGFATPTTETEIGQACSRLGVETKRLWFNGKRKSALHQERLLVVATNDEEKWTPSHIQGVQGCPGVHSTVNQPQVPTEYVHPVLPLSGHPDTRTPPRTPSITEGVRVSGDQAGTGAPSADQERGAKVEVESIAVRPAARLSSRPPAQPFSLPSGITTWSPPTVMPPRKAAWDSTLTDDELAATIRWHIEDARRTGDALTADELEFMVMTFQSVLARPDRRAIIMRRLRRRRAEMMCSTGPCGKR